MQAFNEYLAALRKNLAQGDSTEHTHRLALQRLIETVKAKVTVINEAQRIQCGAPDLTLRSGPTPLAHIETKDIGTNLDEVEKGRGPHGEQFKRYKEGLPNWLLTDYLRFDWFVGGEFRKSVTLATLDRDGKLHPLPGGVDALNHLFGALTEADVHTVETARELARRMAGITHLLRGAIDGAFESGSHSVVAWLSQWLASFRETLIPELKTDQFADMFAQTLAYGLFAARIQTSRSGQPFSHAEALLAVPKSNPFLRKIFSEMAGADMPTEFKWAVDDLVRLLQMSDIAGILKGFGKETGQNDPIVHFYETFLAAYDPKLREKRGVYYTPEPVVRYIVRSVDSLLKTHFGKPKGLADEKTLILDPATGTATFLYEVIAQIRESMKGQEGGWPGYVREHLLGRIFGFELLMAPYAVAHLKLGLELEQTGYQFAEGERLGIYLTNTLEEAAKRSERIIAKAISDEAEAAAEIKREKPILVVLGNPPYSGHSANRSRDSDGHLTFIGKLIEDYKVVDGTPLGEKNPKWLQDDYVKFIRFAQWRIDKTGSGIVAFITNHGYLDNPTFRGMRRSLMASFSEIYIYDLHGNSKRKERTPSGDADENVFDIQQGVAIFIGIKKPANGTGAIVHHSDCYGTREVKYQSLNTTDHRTTKWSSFTPQAPGYLYIEQNDELRREYATAFPLPQIFPIGSIGIVTARDSLTLDFTVQELEGKARKFISLDPEYARLAFDLGNDTQDWNIASAQRDLGDFIRSGGIETAVLYRPFDSRFTYYTGQSRGFHCRPRREVMQHMLEMPNLALLFTRPMSPSYEFSVLATSSLSDQCTVGNKSAGAGVTYEAPLFLTEKSEGGLFEGKHPNLSSASARSIAEKLNLPLEGALPKGITAEDIFDYIYAIFYAPSYRARYSEFLKRDFPRVPLTSSLDLFHALAAKGRQLVALHLLKVEEAPQLNDFITQFPIAGSSEVTKVKYDAAKQRVDINDEQYFAEVPAETWNFHIGGYQVLEKWLKDRKGRTLTFDDIRHWQRTAVALTETKRLMREIDDLIPSWPLA